MPIFGDCADATRANIHWSLGGDIVYQSGVFFIEHLEANMSMIAALGQIIGIEILDSNGQIVACCPDGYHLNPDHLTCEPDLVAPGPNPPDPGPTPWIPIPIPPIPIPIPPIPIPGPPEPQPPECGGDDCDWHQQIGYYLTIIVEILLKITVPPEPPEPTPTDECCLKMLPIIASIQIALQSIATAIANATGGGSTPPDLEPVVIALLDIRTAIENLPAPAPVDFTTVVQALDRLTVATTDGDTAIAKAIDGLKLDDAAGLALVRQVLAYSSQQGTVDPALAQILGA
jgi:hypothetical protein